MEGLRGGHRSEEGRDHSPGVRRAAGVLGSLLGAGGSCTPFEARNRKGYKKGYRPFTALIRSFIYLVPLIPFVPLFFSRIRERSPRCPPAVCGLLASYRVSEEGYKGYLGYNSSVPLDAQQISCTPSCTPLRFATPKGYKLAVPDHALALWSRPPRRGLRPIRRWFCNYFQPSDRGFPCKHPDQRGIALGNR